MKMYRTIVLELSLDKQTWYVFDDPVAPGTTSLFMSVCLLQSNHFFIPLSLYLS